MAGMQEWKGNEKSNPSVFCSEPFGCDLHVALSSLGSPVLCTPVASWTGLVLTDFMRLGFPTREATSTTYPWQDVLNRGDLEVPCEL